MKVESPLRSISEAEPSSAARTVAPPRPPAASPPVYREIPPRPAAPLPADGTLGRSFKNRFNNLLLIRLFLSLTVVFSHSFALANGPEPGDWLKRHTTAHWGTPGITIGYSAVDLFFVVSGFLVTHSFIRSRSIGDFAKKRFWRIWPAYIIAALMCLLLIGPAVLAKWPAVAYSEWPRFFVDVLLLRLYTIPGIFADNPFPNALNGSMWTIKYEVMCYVFIALTWTIGFLQRRHLIATLFALSATYYGLQVSGILEGTMFKPWLPGKVAFLVGEASEWPRMLTCYLAGMTLYVYRDALPHKWWMAILSAALLIGAGFVGPWLLLPLIPLLLGYAMFCAAFTTHGRAYTSKIDKFDLSYGVYLYAFPIQQTIVHFVPATHGNPMLLFALAYPTVLVVAYLSMRFIEQRFQVAKTPAGVDPGLRKAQTPASE